MRTPRNPLFLWLLGTTAAIAQTVVPPGHLPVSFNDFAHGARGRELRCTVTRVNPLLEFGLRSQAGFRAEVPLLGYTGRASRWSVVLRVTPERPSEGATWLHAETTVPAIGEAKAFAEISGAFLTGEGKYRVEMLLIDDNNRACRKRWTIRARLDRRADRLPPGLPAGAVDDLLLSKWGSRRVQYSGNRGYDVSIF